jgi:hypothetical protein
MIRRNGRNTLLHVLNSAMACTGGFIGKEAKILLKLVSLFPAEK